MECASIMSVGQFRKKEVYQFLYAADCLDDSSWDERILGSVPSDLRERILVVAIELACRLNYVHKFQFVEKRMAKAVLFFLYILI